ncbi:MAG: hypothetical protein ACYCYI_09450 [Saccharofermentanales bacterium]
MSEVIETLKKHLKSHDLHFTKKPILIGGMAMEYYGMRKSGEDIDLVICDHDYQSLAKKYPENRKDIWGDLGVVIDPFEIWRCIMLLDYDFYLKDAIEESAAFVVSLDRLLLMRVFAMDVPKYMEDLKLMKTYYCQTFQNPSFIKDAEANIDSYKSAGGIVYGGKYTRK